MEKRFNIERIPLAYFYLTTDKQKRIRLSADILGEYGLKPSSRVTIGYDRAAAAIAIRMPEIEDDPEDGRIDKRGYIPAGKFFNNTRLTPEFRRYNFAGKQDGWLVFIAEETEDAD